MEDLQILEVILAFPSIANLKSINVKIWYSMSMIISFKNYVIAKYFNMITFFNWEKLENEFVRISKKVMILEKLSSFTLSLKQNYI